MKILNLLLSFCMLILLQSGAFAYYESQESYGDSYNYGETNSFEPNSGSDSYNYGETNSFEPNSGSDSYDYGDSYVKEELTVDAVIEESEVIAVTGFLKYLDVVSGDYKLEEVSGNLTCDGDICETELELNLDGSDVLASIPLETFVEGTTTADSIITTTYNDTGYSEFKLSVSLKNAHVKKPSVSVSFLKHQRIDTETRYFVGDVVMFDTINEFNYFVEKSDLVHSVNKNHHWADKDSSGIYHITFDYNRIPALRHAGLSLYIEH